MLHFPKWACFRSCFGYQYCNQRRIGEREDLSSSLSYRLYKVISRSSRSARYFFNMFELAAANRPITWSLRGSGRKQVGRRCEWRATTNGSWNVLVIFYYYLYITELSSFIHFSFTWPVHPRPRLELTRWQQAPYDAFRYLALYTRYPALRHCYQIRENRDILGTFLCCHLPYSIAHSREFLCIVFGAYSTAGLGRNTFL